MFWVLAGVGLLLAGLVFHVQLSQTGFWAAAVGLILALAGLYWLRGHSAAWGWGALLLLSLAVGTWYLSLSPREDRLWALDVARSVKATRHGDEVELRDIRDFDWITKDEAKERWITRKIALDRLSSVEMFTSVWSSPHIAHVLVSFGVEGEEPVVFSAEIRREKGEEFNELGGFFRQFELALIGATERDIVRLRSHLRGEQVSRYVVELNPNQRRQLFLAFVGLAERLEAAPSWYNTITANCTTVVWRLARMLDPGLPLDLSLILPGHLPGYLERLGYLGGSGTLAEKEAAARLSPAAIDARVAAGESFSQAIRPR